MPANIFKCFGIGCPLRYTCRRFTSLPSLYEQSYVDALYSKEDKSCAFYFPTIDLRD